MVYSVLKGLLVPSNINSKEFHLTIVQLNPVNLVKIYIIVSFFLSVGVIIAIVIYWCISALMCALSRAVPLRKEPPHGQVIHGSRCAAG